MSTSLPTALGITLSHSLDNLPIALGDALSDTLNNSLSKALGDAIAASLNSLSQPNVIDDIDKHIKELLKNVAYLKTVSLSLNSEEVIITDNILLDMNIKLYRIINKNDIDILRQQHVTIHNLTDNNNNNKIYIIKNMTYEILKNIINIHSIDSKLKKQVEDLYTFNTYTDNTKNLIFLKENRI
jgi:hypothetical protein